MRTYSDSGTHSSAEVLDDEVDEPIYEPLQDRRAPGVSVKQRKIPRAQKRKVDRAAKPVCLIERVSRESVIEYCHVIGMEESDDVLDYLEYNWGMSRYTLNLHTRYNICILGPRFHYLFDHKGLLFLPTLEIIEQYSAHEIHTPLPYKPDDPDAETRTFEYRLLVPPSMKSVPIFRRKVEDSKSTNAEDYEVHPFPYNTFPVIKSHVLPHFVIYNAGKKLAAMSNKPAVYGAFITTNAHIEGVSDVALKAMDLFYRWTRADPLPADWMSKSPPSMRKPPSHSSRVPTEPPRQSKRPAEEGGCPTMSKRAKKDDSQGEQALGQLDARSVKKLDRRSDRQIYQDTRSSIDKWRGSVVNDELEAETSNEGDMENMC
ncbi:hypothetical protein M413DRAFT_443076 [Hebeloma cylindrosporum]|uniref:HNH nuclease domain-containing protein n=1 Tax=Hebeloma cylindrosporum TaxID=76867 RepID=A0A0C3CJS6_HEBCY|nr:hypothetical protein M413DRAFT_443076 [Hebeloma cylindrosporum h7]